MKKPKLTAPLEAAPFAVPGAEVAMLGDDRARVTWPDGDECVVAGVSEAPDGAIRDALAWKLGR